MSHPLHDLKERIIYHHDGLMVLNKPPDMPSTGRNLDDQDCLQWHLMHYMNDMVWAIHQLDADTSGLNLFCTDKQLITIYKTALSHKHSIKEYLAICRGNPSWNEHTIEAPIGKIDEYNMGVCTQGKSAKTSFTIIDRNSEASLMRVHIETGRTHQIRIHAAHLGHPLIGEEWYCNPPCTKHPRQALHAHKLHLQELPDNKPSQFTVGLPADLVEALHRFGLSYHKYE